MKIMTATKKYTDIPVPALAIFAIPHVRAQSSDTALRKAIEAYFTSIDALAEKQPRAFAEGVPTARVVRLGGTHYIFLSNEQDVLREMRAFLAGLKRSSAAGRRLVGPERRERVSHQAWSGEG